jgi:hypothetical protein
VLLQSDEEGLLSSLPESPILQHGKLQEHDSLPESPIAKHENPKESEPDEGKEPE